MNHPTKTRFGFHSLVAGLLLAAILAGLILASRRSENEEGTGAGGARAETNLPAARRDAGERGSLPRVLRKREKERRQSDLASLKERWLALKDNDPDGSKAIKLTEESLWLLSCSDELVELIMFLREAGVKGGIMYPMKKHLLEESLHLFSGPDAAEARSNLCRVGNLAFRRYWSFEAGLNCPDEEFGEFRDSLGDGMAARNAEYGRCVRLARSEPVEAWRKTLELLPEEFFENYFVGHADKQTKLAPDKSAIVLRKIVDNTSSPEALREMLEMLPPASHKREIGHPLRLARTSLLYRWAESEPKEATDYILAHLPELEPQDMLAVSRYSTDLDWINAHVPKGPYYDYLLDIILDGREDVNSPEFLKMAASIGDPERREFNLSRGGEEMER